MFYISFPVRCFARILPEVISRMISQLLQRQRNRSLAKFNKFECYIYIYIYIVIDMIRLTKTGKGVGTDRVICLFLYLSS